MWESLRQLLVIISFAFHGLWTVQRGGNWPPTDWEIGEAIEPLVISSLYRYVMMVCVSVRKCADRILLYRFLPPVERNVMSHVEWTWSIGSLNAMLEYMLIISMLIISMLIISMLIISSCLKLAQQASHHMQYNCSSNLLYLQLVHLPLVFLQRSHSWRFSPAMCFAQEQISR